MILFLQVSWLLKFKNVKENVKNVKISFILTKLMYPHEVHKSKILKTGAITKQRSAVALVHPNIHMLATTQTNHHKIWLLYGQLLLVPVCSNYN